MSGPAGAPLVVKICGFTRAADAAAAACAGADWLGLNFWPRSKRYIAAEPGRAVAEAARAAAPGERGPLMVGLFVNQPAEHVAAVAGAVGLDAVQLHGDESPEQCAELAAGGLTVIKALAMSGPEDIERLTGYPCATVLIDTP
ncbi:MAG: hypothetical protein AAGC55_29165, partial [Myxococcota bacterium]